MGTKFLLKYIILTLRFTLLFFIKSLSSQIKKHKKVYGLLVCLWTHPNLSRVILHEFLVSNKIDAKRKKKKKPVCEFVHFIKACT